MKAALQKLTLREAAQLLGDEVEEKWDFEDDEYVAMRHPLSCPLKYVWEDSKQAAEFQKLADDDPKKIEIVEKRNHLTNMWAFADWLIYDEEGNPIPPVHPNDDAGWWLLSPGQQFFLEILMMKLFYPKAMEAQENALPITLEDDEDPLLEKA